MKKQMTNENLMRISEFADRSVTDSSVASVLLCYLLYRIDTPLDVDLLYEIAVTGNIINYFAFQDALDSMLTNGSVTITETEKGKVYTLLPKGVDFAKRLKTIAAKSYRDHIVLAATKALRRKNNRNDVKVDYENAENGCYLRVALTDNGTSLLELKLFTPDLTQAKKLGEGIMDNPADFYHRVMQAAFEIETPPLDLSDN